jgi:nucleoside phosphorylase
VLRLSAGRRSRYSASVPPKRCDVAVLTVIGAELDAVLRAFGIAHDAGYHRGGSTFWRASVPSTASDRSLDVVVHCQGVAGNENASLAATKLIERFNPRLMVLSGIAAGRRGKLKIGDVAIPIAVADVSQKVATAMGMADRPTIRPLPHAVTQLIRPFSASHDRFSARFHTMSVKPPTPPAGSEAEYAEHVAASPSVYEFVIASQDVLLRDPQILENYAAGLHQQIQVGEMEAGGFVAACESRSPQVPWLVARGISDFGDTLKNDDFHRVASIAAAAYVAEFCDRGLDIRIFDPARKPRKPASERKLADYRRALLGRIAPMKFVGVGAHPLTSDALETLFIPPMLREPTPRRRRERARADRDSPPTNAVPRPWRDCLPVAEQPALLVLGDLGTGKSTALRTLARQLCRETGSIPLFIELSKFAEARTDMMKYAESQAQELSGGLFHQLDQERRFLWLLDGLDEVLEEGQRIRVLAAIHTLQSGDGHPRLVVVSSRRQPEPQLSSVFVRRELAAWRDTDTEAFIRSYHQALHPGEVGERNAQELLHALRAIPALRALCTTPLFLAFVLSLGRSGDLPWPRPRLYLDALRLVLEKWDVARHTASLPRRLSSDDKLRFLGHVAWDMLGHRRLTIARDELVQLASTWIVDTFGANDGGYAALADALVRDLSLRGTLLVPDDGGQLTFALRAWFDCAAARYLRDRHTDAELAGHFASQWQDPLWSEALLLVAGGMADERAAAILPPLRSVLSSIRSLDQWQIGSALSFLILAMCSCSRLRHEPIVSFARALTDIVLVLYEDVSSGLAPALREAGPHWPDAERLYCNSSYWLALAVCDSDSRIDILCRHLPLLEYYSEHLGILLAARRFGPFSTADVERLLAVSPLEHRYLNRYDYSYALRVHIAACLAEMDRDSLVLDFLATELHASSPGRRIYAALTLISLGAHEEALITLEAAAMLEIWPDAPPSPMRMFLSHVLENCHRRLPAPLWQRVYNCVSTASSEFLKGVAERDPRPAPASQAADDSDQFSVRLLLKIDHDVPLSEETISAALVDASPNSAAHALESVAISGVLPASTWRRLASELCDRYESTYRSRQDDWRISTFAWRECADHASAVMTLACLLDERDTLRRLIADERHEEVLRDSACRHLEIGGLLDTLARVGE